MIPAGEDEKAYDMSAWKDFLKNILEDGGVEAGGLQHAR